ncbi:hypothetical protein OAA86_08160 [Rhodospirillales bacterium]|nr:hypothetical protein [Rhodospirillales bacterium]
MPKSKVEQHTIFIVRSSRTIDSTEYIAPTTREDAFDFGSYDLQDAESLVERANDVHPVMWELLRQYEECHLKKLENFKSDEGKEAYEEEWPKYADEEIAEKWVLQLSEQEFKVLRSQMEKWAESEPDRSSDETDYFVVPSSGQDYAYKFFQDHTEHEVLDELGIDIVEGEYPGSTYYAAELSIPVEEANDKAEKAGIPIRFVVAEE